MARIGVDGMDLVDCAMSFLERLIQSHCLKCLPIHCTLDVGAVIINRPM